MIHATLYDGLNTTFEVQRHDVPASEFVAAGECFSVVLSEGAHEIRLLMQPNRLWELEAAIRAARLAWLERRGKTLDVEPYPSPGVQPEGEWVPITKQETVQLTEGL